MKITLINGTTKVLLADHGASSPSDLQVEVAGAVQTGEFVRAVQARSWHRGNRRTSLRFGVTRLHDSLPAAMAFLTLHAAEMSVEGLLVIEYRGSNGQRGERYLPECVVASVSSRHTGCTTFHEYQLVGGLLTSVRPL